jgi:methionyl-tRNA synthetase
MPYSQDAVFSPESFVERYNFDLCNDLSNLVNRTVSMVNKYFDGKIESYNGTFNNFDKEIEDLSNNQIKLFEEKMDNFEIANALKEIWVLIARANKYIDETSPWILAKEENNQEELKSVMYHLVETLRRIAILISPFMNDTAKNIFNQLGISDELQTWDSLNNYNNLNNIRVIEKGEPIFMRLNMDEEIEYIKSKM